MAFLVSARYVSLLQRSDEPCKRECKHTFVKKRCRLSQVHYVKTQKTQLYLLKQGLSKEGFDDKAFWMSPHLKPKNSSNDWAHVCVRVRVRVRALSVYTYILYILYRGIFTDISRNLQTAHQEVNS